MGVGGWGGGCFFVGEGGRRGSALCGGLGGVYKGRVCVCVCVCVCCRLYISDAADVFFCVYLCGRFIMKIKNFVIVFAPFCLFSFSFSSYFDFLLNCFPFC